MVSRAVSGSRLSLATLIVLFAHIGVSAEPPAEIAQRFAGAQRAVVGKVSAVQSRWERNGWGDELIISRLSVAVEESLKGSSPRQIEVDVEGGTLDGVTLHVSHQVVLAPGDRAVLILNEVSPGIHVPHRKGQGLLRVGADDRIEGNSSTLADVRAAARSAAAR